MWLLKNSISQKWSKKLCARMPYKRKKPEDIIGENGLLKELAKTILERALQAERRNWARITPFFNYPLDIRKAIYTTNSVESLNRSLRKIIKTRGGFPNEEAALKLLFLALRQAAKKWTMPIHHWREALNQHRWGEGRDAAPSLAHPSQKPNPGRSHRRVDTPHAASVRFDIVLFPLPAHRIGQADFPHPALGKDAHRTEIRHVTPSATPEHNCGVARLVVNPRVLCCFWR